MSEKQSSSDDQQPPSEMIPVTGSGSVGFIDEAMKTFDGVWRLAKVMANAGTMPVHLQKPEDCFRVVVQAAKWHMDPYSVAECTSVVHGRLCYEGKLIATVLRSMNAISAPLDYEITGEGQDAMIIVTGTPMGGTPKTVKGSVKDWRTFTYKKDRNGKKTDQKIPNAWDKQPEDQLIYRGTRQWARRYAPWAMLGIYTDDEMEDVKEVEATVVDDASSAIDAVVSRYAHEPSPSATDEPSPPVHAADSAPVAADLPSSHVDDMPAGEKVHDSASNEPLKDEDIQVDVPESITHADVERLMRDCYDILGEWKHMNRIIKKFAVSSIKDLSGENLKKIFIDTARLKYRIEAGESIE